MKNAFLLLVSLALLIGCGQTEKAHDNTAKSSTPTTDSTTSASAPKPSNCQSVVDAKNLGKADVYQESGKSIKVTLTLNQDSSSTQSANSCYFNNTITVMATKKSGSQLFKRTLLKDDLLYFTKTDDAINKSILQKVIYKPTFNGQRYITLTMHLLEPDSKKTMDYTLFMNYFGEIVKVK
ncbi:hypothetical protein GO730_06740 [Spirosoma sp. HMF3257]|uniref:DUF4738 domain-containing protein n=1 Tax=Spirosoma telluris TaxID=2183553 RepID=A0A327NNC0_9BACT|nr:hypothetical protein [Spirosoma telluris]RAI74108.1 hypothetical protein HMF3257_06680 [Spirosoma telluris]